MIPAGAGTELQYRDGASLGAVGGTSVSGHVVTLTAEDGSNQRVLVLNGDYPRIHLQGDGTEHFVDASHIQGISFGNNYYFGIGANLESAAGAAILVQANGSVIIPNIQFGYIGPVGGGAADTFGRVEGQKMALQFGTEGQYGLRIFDQFGGHPQYLGTMLVESAKADGPVFVVRARADQTAPLVEAQTSTGATLVRVTAGGDVELTTPGRGVVLTSPDGTHYRLGVSDAGTAVFTALP